MHSDNIKAVQDSKAMANRSAIGLVTCGVLFDTVCFDLGYSAGAWGFDPWVITSGLILLGFLPAIVVVVMPMIIAATIAVNRKVSRKWIALFALGFGIVYFAAGYIAMANGNHAPP